MAKLRVFFISLFSIFQFFQFLFFLKNVFLLRFSLFFFQIYFIAGISIGVQLLIRFAHDLWQGNGHNLIHGEKQKVNHLHIFGMICGIGIPRSAPRCN